MTEWPRKQGKSVISSERSKSSQQIESDRQLACAAGARRCRYESGFFEQAVFVEFLVERDATDPQLRRRSLAIVPVFLQGTDNTLALGPLGTLLGDTPRSRRDSHAGTRQAGPTPIDQMAR